MALEIVVMIKQVPDSQEVEIDPVTKTLNRMKARNVLNVADDNALEAALSIKDRVESHVTIVSMGPPMADEAILECMGKGADRGVLLTDRAFAGADTYPTGLTLAAAVTKLGKFDIIFAGEETSDSSTGHVGPGVAEFLGIEQITYTRSVRYEDGYVIGERELEDGIEIVKAKPPVLITVRLGSNIPRRQTLRKKIDAIKTGVESWTLQNLGIPAEWVGFKGSPTVVRSMKTIKEKERAARKITVDEIAELVKGLAGSGVINMGVERK